MQYKGRYTSILSKGKGFCTQVKGKGFFTVLKPYFSCKDSYKLKYIANLPFYMSTYHHNCFYTHIYTVLHIHLKWHLNQSNGCPSTLQCLISIPFFLEKSTLVFAEELGPKWYLLGKRPLKYAASKLLWLVVTNRSWYFCA